MYELYDVGYMEIKDLPLFEKVVKALNAVVIDARFKPKSRDARWIDWTLKKHLGMHYVHVKALGNENYKGGPIKFVDLNSGLEQIAHYLNRQNVIVMCGCWNRETCHRTEAVGQFETLTQIQSRPLTKALCLEIVAAPENAAAIEQRDLFNWQSSDVDPSP